VSHSTHTSMRREPRAARRCRRPRDDVSVQHQGGGIEFGHRSSSAGDLARQCRAAIANAVDQADANHSRTSSRSPRVALTTAPTGCDHQHHHRHGVSTRARDPKIAHGVGGHFGPAIKPIALRMVSERRAGVRCRSRASAAIQDFTTRSRFFLRRCQHGSDGRKA